MPCLTVAADAPLLARLEAVAARYAEGADPGHDLLHVCRVTENARRIGAAEGADLDVVLPAALLHELVNLPKDHPDSPRSGERCAEEAGVVLRAEGVAPKHIEAICYAIRVHPFSLGVVLPETAEARILQDADRLDALGAVGIARVFSTGATMGRPFYAPEDPFCVERAPDDKQWTLDHFYRKLLRLPDTLHTPTARAMATERAAFLRTYLDELAREIGSDSGLPLPTAT
jgi:uncharacterized protein